MIVPIAQFAAEEAPSGIAALGFNVPAFLFQLLSFVIVLLILRKFAFGKLVATLEARRKTVEDSIKQAAETEVKLKKAEQTIAGMLAEARTQADAVVAVSHKEASQMLQDAENKAAKRAEHIVTEAKSQMDIEIGKARDALKDETAKLVALATERIIGEKLNANQDSSLINSAIKSAKERLNG